MLRIGYGDDPGSSLCVSVRRLADGLWWDGASFGPATAAKAAPLPESPAVGGLYELAVETPAEVWTPDRRLVYEFLVCVRLFPGGKPGAVKAVLKATLYDGDDAPPPPAAVVVQLPAGSRLEAK